MAVHTPLRITIQYIYYPQRDNSLQPITTFPPFLHVSDV